MEVKNKERLIGEEEPAGNGVLEFDTEQKAITVTFFGKQGGMITSYYRTLRELNDEWEDV